MTSSDNFKTQDMCIEAVCREPSLLMNVPDHFKTQDMCIRAVKMNPDLLVYATWCLKTHDMCKEAVCRIPSTLEYVPDHLKTEDICKEAVRREPHIMRYDIFTIDINKVVVSDKVPCNNGKDCCYIVGYQVDEALVPVFIKTPKNIFSHVTTR